MHSAIKIGFASIGFLILSWTWSACKKNRYQDIPALAERFSYFPLNPGNTYTYKLNRITFDAFNNQSDTVNWLIKDVHDTFFIDNLGRNALRVFRYLNRSNSLNQPWDTTYAYYIVQDEGHLEMVYNNRRDVIFSLPIAEGITWNTHVFNEQDEHWVFLDMSQSELIVQDHKFSNCVQVRSLPGPYFNPNISRIDIYAPNLGLVKREYNHVVNRSGRPQGIKDQLEIIEYEIKP